MFFQTNMLHISFFANPEYASLHNKNLRMEFVQMYLFLKQILIIWKSSILTIVCISILHVGGNDSQCVVHQSSVTVFY